MPTPAGGQACLRAGRYTHCSAKGSRFMQIAENGQGRGLALHYSAKAAATSAGSMKELKSDRCEALLELRGLFVCLQDQMPGARRPCPLPCSPPSIKYTGTARSICKRQSEGQTTFVPATGPEGQALPPLVMALPPVSFCLLCCIAL